MVCYCTLLLFLASSVLARVREIEINISVGRVDADCSGQSYEKLLVDGQYPAPPIRVTKGDQVNVTVRNAKDTNRVTSIHFHGILQIGTTEADGFPGLTQAEIPPGTEFHQNFRVIDQTGTYFYHAHTDLQGNSIYGPLIVYETDDDWPGDERRLHEGPYEYDDELTLTLSEWWHREEQEVVDYILGPTFDGMPQPQSHLLNGRTIFDPSHIPEGCKGFSVLEVKPDKTYRLRVIGSQSFSGMDIAVENHTLTVIEVDGVLIKPYETDYLPVEPGIRYSVLLSTSQAPGTYKIGVKSTTSNGLADLRYQHDKEPRHDDVEQMVKDLLHGLNASAYASTVTNLGAAYYQQMEPVVAEHDDFGEPADRTIILTPVEVQLPDNTTRWLINNRPAPKYDPPLIDQLARMKLLQLNSTAVELNKAGLTDGYDEGHQAYPLRAGEIVDVVIHATMYHTPNVCRGHPWHTHGMAHYPIANGPGEYIHERDKYIRTFSTPIARDTTYVDPYHPSTDYLPSGTPCGWMKLRLYVSNPGVWGVHCHITGHMLQGMVTTFEVEPEQIPVLQR